MSDELDPKAGTPDPEGTDDAAADAALGGTPGEDGRDAGEDTGDGDGNDALLQTWKAKAERANVLEEENARKAERTNALEEENARLRDELRRHPERDAGSLSASERSLEAMQEDLDEEAADIARLRMAAKNPEDAYARQMLRDRERQMRFNQQNLDQTMLARIPEGRRATVERLWDEAQAKGGDVRFQNVAALDRAVQWKMTQDENKRLREEVDLLRKGKKPGPVNGKLPASKRSAGDVPPTDGGAPPLTKGNAAPMVVKREEFRRTIAELEASPNKADFQKSIALQLRLSKGEIVYEEHLRNR